MDDTQNPETINEKWIVIIIWVSLLALLYVTTSTGSIAGFGGSVRSFYQTFAPTGSFTDLPVLDNPVVMAASIVMLIMAIILIVQLLSAWWKFIELTNQVIIAFVQRSIPGESNPILFELLNFEPEGKNAAEQVDDTNEDTVAEVIDTAPEDAVGSLVGNVLRAIAISWAVIILTPGIIIFISMNFR